MQLKNSPEIPEMFTFLCLFYGIPVFVNSSGGIHCPCTLQNGSTGYCKPLYCKPHLHTEDNLNRAKAMVSME